MGFLSKAGAVSLLWPGPGALQSPLGLTLNHSLHERQNRRNKRGLRPLRH
jgi:hypothetical protein